MLIEKKRVLKAVKIIFIVLVFYFLTRYFVHNMDEIKALNIRLDWGVFALSMLFYFLYKLTLASLWHYITKINNCNIKYTNAVSSYLYSILGKYIPGKVFMLAARMPAYQKEGVPLRKVTVCFFIENICTLLGAAFLALISLFFFPNDLLQDYAMIITCFVIVFFICINPKVINFFLKHLGRLIKKKDMEISMTYGQMVKVVLLFIANWFVVGVGFYMLVCSIYPIPFEQMLFTGGIFGLSAIIGIISIFAPAGLGVREGILIAGLLLIMSHEYAVIISVVSRLWGTVSELILILIAFFIEKIRTNISVK